jgi:uncharacterized membrane protein
MKLFPIVSLLTFLLLTNPVSAQLGYFGVTNTVGNGGETSSALSIIFSNITETFQFSIQAPITSILTTDNAVCTYQGVSITSVNCNLNLNQSSRTIGINITSNSFIKQQGNYFTFNQGFIVNDQITRVTDTLVMPVGATIADQPNSLYPADAQTLSNGQNIIVFWESRNASPNQLLSFQAVYQQPILPASIPLWQLLTVGVLAAVTAGFFVYRRFRKPEEVVLSVLDEYERKVMEVIQAAGGMINQRRVVDHTNFSKAKVSRVVGSLVKRGVIEAERRGRTNLIRLKKNFGSAKPENAQIEQNSSSTDEPSSNEVI